MRARCDDHVEPKPPSSLDVKHVSPVLDVCNGLVLAQYPTTSVWLDSAHGLNALMCACSVGLDNTPYVKILSHVRFLTISTHSEQGNGRAPSCRVGAGPRQTAKPCHQCRQTGTVFLSQRGEF